jgi:lysophospholipase L1-like esterase
MFLTKCLLIVFVFVGLVPAQQEFFLKDGDTVVFYGDSITDQRLYTTFVETFAVTRYPRFHLKFVHSGWGGDRVSGGGGGTIDERVRRDVIAYNPSVMTIMLGMNDGSYRAFDDAIFAKYKAGFEHIIEAVRQALPALRITVIQPSPYDDVTRAPMFEGGYNEVLVKYGDFLRELASKNNLSIADLNTPVVDALKRANAADPKAAQQIIPDRIHPQAAGHLIMAEVLLKAWRATPIVTTVEIDSPGTQVRSAVGTAVSDLKASGSRITWTQKDERLPMPINLDDAVMKLAVSSSRIIEDLDEQVLKVTGLGGSNYSLAINGKSVGTFSREQLAGGINLALLPTPMMAQAAAVHALTLKRAAVHNTRWRNLQTPFEKETIPRVPTILDNLDALDSDVAALQHSAAQPSTCFYELAAAQK